MKRSEAEINLAGQKHRGIALLVTLILLIVLSAMAYTLSAKVSAQRHRNQYLIDYQSARYGCDSAVRLAVARLADLDVNLISRPNEPDFSDVFHFTQQEYEDYLTAWKNYQMKMGISSMTEDANKATQTSNKSSAFDNKLADMNKLKGLGGNLTDTNSLKRADANGINDVNSQRRNNPGDFNDFNEIPGPYGPAWPLVTKAEELEIGQAKVKIEIEDEDAKFPLGWAVLDDKNVEREKKVAFETFFEWWKTGKTDQLEQRIYNLADELDSLSQVETFTMNFQDKTVVSRMGTLPDTTSARSTVPIRTYTRTTTVGKDQQQTDQEIAFTKLFHSSVIDMEALAKPIIQSDKRQESILKYMGTWGSKRVNINTAPRNVLEAAFTFGGRPEEIADEIIKRRKIEPFKSIEQLKQSLFSYSDSIDKCKDYITTVSTDFSLKITSICGVAKVTVIVAATKNGKIIKKVAVMSS